MNDRNVFALGIVLFGAAGWLFYNEVLTQDFVRAGVFLVVVAAGVWVLDWVSDWWRSRGND